VSSNPCTKAQEQELEVAQVEVAQVALSFEIKIDVHQRSCSSPLLFINIIDAVGEAVRREVPWEMLYTDDLIVAEDAAHKLQIRFNEWQNVLES